MTHFIDSEDTLRIQNEIDWGFSCAEDSIGGEYQVESKDGKLLFVFLKSGLMTVYTATGEAFYFKKGESATPAAIWRSSPAVQESWRKEFPKFAALMRLV